MQNYQHILLILQALEILLVSDISLMLILTTRGLKFMGFFFHFSFTSETTLLCSYFQAASFFFWSGFVLPLT